MSAGSDHIAIGEYESAICEPTGWDHWIDDVERLLGHSADGDHSTDGYSMDSFHEMWRSGLTAAAAAHTAW